MDPLSAAASVITLLQISAHVIFRCQKYFVEVKESRKDISRLRNQVISVEDVVHSIHDMEQSLDRSRLAVVRALSRTDGPIDSCTKELVKIREKLPIPKHGWSFRMKTLIWPFSSENIEKVLVRLERDRALLHLALSVDHTTILLAIEKGIDAVNVQVLETKAEVLDLKGAFASDQEKRERKEFIEWLKCPDTVSAHQVASKKIEPATGEWFTRSAAFNEWKATKGKPLWLSGMPGCGKTVLSAIIIEQLHAYCDGSHTYAYAYYYFDFSDIKRQGDVGFLAAILTQICMQQPDVIPVLLKYKTKRLREGAQPNTFILTELLRECARFKGISDIFIVADAIDECPATYGQSARGHVLYLLGEIQSWEQSNIHILLTSRREQDIEKKFSSMPLLFDIPIKADDVDADIRRYVKSFLETDEHMSQWPDDTRSEIEQVLSQNAKGMFRWVQCHLESLKRRKTRNDLREALNSLPKNLDQTYERMITNIEEEDQERAKRALIWLAFSLRPLTLQEITEAAAFDPLSDFDTGDRLLGPSSLLEILGSLVTITPVATINAFPEMDLNGAKQIDCMQLAHFTVKEYLQCDRLLKGSLRTFSISPSSSEIFLTQVCAKYLQQPSKSHNETENEMTLDDYPLFLYSWRLLDKHVAQLPQENLPEVDLFLSEVVQTDVVMTFDGLKPSMASRLLYAINHNMKTQVRQLIDSGASVDDAPEGCGHRAKEKFPCPLRAAIIKQHEDVVDLLLQAGATLDMTDGLDSLFYDIGGSWSSMTEVEMRILELLLAQGLDPNIRDKNNEAPLHVVVTDNNIEVVRMLLENGADPNAIFMDHDGTEYTPLSLARIHNDSSNAHDIADLLLKWGAEDIQEAELSVVKAEIAFMQNTTFRPVADMLERRIIQGCFFDLDDGREIEKGNTKVMFSGWQAVNFGLSEQVDIARMLFEDTTIKHFDSANGWYS